MSKLTLTLVVGLAYADNMATPDVHEERRAQIVEINRSPGVLWTAAPQERFASQAPGASKHMMGVKGDWKASIEEAIKSGKVERFPEELTAVEVPEEFDSETNWPKCAKIIGDIRDQSNCGCCWAFGAAEAASDRMCIASDGELMLPLSAQDVCFTASDDGCDGGDINSPWDYISETGAVTGGQYHGTGPFGKGLCLDFSLPHCHHHGPQGEDPYPAEGAPGCPSQESPSTPRACDADAEAPHNDFKADKYTFSGRTQSASGPNQIKQAIMAGGPVETAFTVYSDFENYAGGIYHHVSGSMAGGHAVKIVGWGVESGTKYWKVANSWNPYWGEKGYFRIKEGEGGIDSMVTFSPAKAKWSKKGDTTDVHEERSAQIVEINKSPGVLWTAAPQERFASQAPGASKHMMGVKGDWKASIEEAIKSGKVERFPEELAAVEVPEEFDSETNWPKCAKIIGDIRDQSNCGCCWAFGAAEAASDRMCIASDGELMLPLSAQDVCFTASDDGCDGGDINSPWDYISETGAVTGGQYHGTGPFGKGLCLDFSLPHCHHHGPQGEDPYPAEGAPGCPSQESPSTPRACDADAEAPHNDFKADKYTFSGRTQSASGPNQIKQAIMAGGPVETAFTVYSDFENYAGGIYHHVSGSMAGGHAVKIVGWGVESGTKYWKVANSWNPYWGEKGYFRIKEGEGGIDSMVTFSPAKAKWSKKGGTTVVV